MIDAVFYAIAALALLAALIKAMTVTTSGRQPGRLELVAVFLALGVACTLLSFTVQDAANRIYPQLGRLTANLMVMTAACALLCLQLTLCTPGRARARIGLRIITLAAALAVMAGCFFSAGHLPDRLGDFGALYQTRPVLRIYIAVYIAFLGTALADLLILTMRFARAAERFSCLRAGLRLLAAGSVLGLIYLAEKIVYVYAQITGIRPPLGTDHDCTSPVTPAQCGFEITVPGAAIVVSVIGATLPVWGPFAAIPLIRIWQARTYRKLGPLWTALRSEFPQITLDTGTGQPGLSWQLNRRIIEILDGLLLLRPWLDPKPAGLPASVAAEAAMITAALHAHAAGAPATTGNRPYTVPGHTDLRSHAAWLAAISTAMPRPR